jgi:hypothetical protein
MFAALGIEPVCERASAKHIGDSPTRSRASGKGSALKKIKLKLRLPAKWPDNAAHRSDSGYP